ncbi:MAG: transposase family protein [Zoogloeaceae bacterium]|nr:transposase family protein [Zoogloeaceae bacterium]
MIRIEIFSNLKDPRGQTKKHDLQEILLMTLCAVLCGGAVHRTFVLTGFQER